MNWFLIALKKYATFSGRSQRAEYWYYTLFSILIYIGAAVLDSVTGTFDAESGMGIIGTVSSLALLVPSLAVTVRRLHDTGRSGWWLLIVLIPLIGTIVLLIFTVQDSKPGDNEYGPNPKGVVA